MYSIYFNTEAIIACKKISGKIQEINQNPATFGRNFIDLFRTVAALLIHKSSSISWHI